jgi:hypothetical protein
VLRRDAPVIIPLKGESNNGEPFGSPFFMCEGMGWLRSDGWKKYALSFRERKLQRKRAGDEGWLVDLCSFRQLGWDGI